MSVAALKTRKKLLGQEIQDTLWGMLLVGNVYKLSDKWEEAESLEVQVIETRKRKLRADYLSTLTSKPNLALTYRN